MMEGVLYWFGLLARLIYDVSVLIIVVYCLYQFYLLLLYFSRRPKIVEHLDDFRPMVTIQLPVYNESAVIRKLLDATYRLNYPKELLEVQILDDSTDETTQLIELWLENVSTSGVSYHHIRRSDRRGYKAGALAHGLESARGEFIAVFDADFVPPPEFLTAAIPFLSKPDVAVVQTRWGHLNRSFNLLTRLQIYQLDAHFVVEQGARYTGHLFCQFNGTAGIWRKTVIESSGGWQHDTLTEDLDLSYRCQINGWRIVYRSDIICPAELPPEINGLCSQQFRWVKGGIQTARKLSRSLLSSTVPLNVKFHGLIHLWSPFVYLFVLSMLMMSVVMWWYPVNISLGSSPYLWAGLVAIILVHLSTQLIVNWSESRIRTVGQFLLFYPFFLAFSLGISCHNAIAVWRGLRDVDAEFIRTPKYGANRWQDQKVSWTLKRLNSFFFIELLLLLVFFSMIILTIFTGDYRFLLLHLMAALGYGLMVIHRLLLI